MDPKFLLRGVELLAVGRHSARKAAGQLSSCERCNELALRSFGRLLDEVLERRPGLTDYVLAEPVTCPNCAGPIFETTSVDYDLPSDAGFETGSENQDWPPEEMHIVLVEDAQLLEAQAFVIACERCASNAEISFEYLLDAVTGCDPSVTEYVMSHRAKCPQCLREITEKTLVIPG